MSEKNWMKPERLDVVIAVLIALVSLTASIAAWRTNVVGSAASDANRKGLIDAFRKASGQNENWRRLYEEAGYARDFMIASAAVEAMEASGNEGYQSAAATQRQYLLPGMQILSDPLGTQVKYLKSDGTFDLEKRIADLEADSPEFSGLDPLDSFKLAEKNSTEQRWLTVGTVLLMISLFWFGMAELTKGRMRVINLFVGLGIYLFSVAFIMFIELIAAIARSGIV